jgi:hypothetical protein
MRQAIEGEVVEIAALASQKAQILAPLRRIADAGSNHRSALFALIRPCLTIAVSGDAPMRWRSPRQIRHPLRQLAAMLPATAGRAMFEGFARAEIETPGTRIHYVPEEAPDETFRSIGISPTT